MEAADFEKWKKTQTIYGSFDISSKSEAECLHLTVFLEKEQLRIELEDAATGARITTADCRVSFEPKVIRVFGHHCRTCNCTAQEFSSCTLRIRIDAENVTEELTSGSYSVTKLSLLRSDFFDGEASCTRIISVPTLKGTKKILSVVGEAIYYV